MVNEYFFSCLFPFINFELIWKLQVKIFFNFGH